MPSGKELKALPLPLGDNHKLGVNAGLLPRLSGAVVAGGSPTEGANGNRGGTRHCAMANGEGQDPRMPGVAVFPCLVASR